MNALDFWGIVEIGYTLICFGILPFISSYSTKRACFDATLHLALAEKLAMDSSAKSD